MTRTDCLVPLVRFPLYLLSIIQTSIIRTLHNSKQILIPRECSSCREPTIHNILLSDNQKDEITIYIRKITQA